MYTAYLQQLLPALRVTNLPRSLYFKPNIPERKLTAALDSYAHILEPQIQKVWFLYDGTLWGGARDGFVITSDLHLYGRTSSYKLRFQLPLLTSTVQVESKKDGANIFVDGTEVLYGSMPKCTWFQHFFACLKARSLDFSDPAFQQS